MNNKQRVENIEYRITQTKKLLNSSDKESEAYKAVKKDLQGLDASLRVAKSSLKKEIDNLKKTIKLVKMQLRTSPHPELKLKCQKEIERLQNQLNKLQ